MRKRRWSYAAFFVPLVLAAPAIGVNFADSTRVNVLRQYNSTGTALLSAESISGTGWSRYPAANDGNGWNDQMYMDNTQTATGTFTLPGPRTVGSFTATLNSSYLPSIFKIEGLVGGTWTELMTVNSPTQNTTGTFAPQTVTSLRYTVTGASPANHVVFHELQVFLSSGQAVPLDGGYNLMRDSGRVNSTQTSTAKSGVWAGVSGSAPNAVDGDYQWTYFHSQFSDRAFVEYTLSESTLMTFAHLGFYLEQGWSRPFEFYTSNAATVPLTQALTTSDKATIQAAGWTLQYSDNSVSREELMPFAMSGMYKHILLVWDSYSGGGAVTELEVFAPEPASLSLLALGGLALLRRRK